MERQAFLLILLSAVILFPGGVSARMKTSSLIQLRSEAQELRQLEINGSHIVNMSVALANVAESITSGLDKKRMSSSVTELYQSDFAGGTYLIETPGTYVLVEDILFEPKTPHHFPPMGSVKYSNEKGFWLGFFAAISIAADGVILDLNGHTISMSKRFSMVQRFFSIIELGSKPFKANVGPPQFAKLSTPLIPAKSVIIMGGTLGRSSHMGIHGTDNSFVVLRNLIIKDFESGGIQLNGAANVHIDTITVGPSLGAPGSAGFVPGMAVLSQSWLLMRVIRGSGHEWDEEFYTLQQALDSFLASDGSVPFGDVGEQGFDGLPDGSALYGILFHKASPAVNDFAACSQAQLEMLNDDPFTNITIRNVEIKDLHLKSDEVVKMLVGEKPVLGPAGDVVQVLRLRNDDDTYKGSPLSNAQRKIAELKASSQAEDLFTHFGSSNIPDQVLQWMKGEGSFKAATEGAAFDCHGDAMSHVNKGVVGLRLEFVDDVTLENIAISGLKNTGEKSKYDSFCSQSPTMQYKGSDVRGVSIGGRTKLEMGMNQSMPFMDDGLPSGVTIDMGSLHSVSGEVKAFVDEDAA